MTTKTFLVTIDVRDGETLSKSAILYALKDKDMLATVSDVEGLKEYSCGYCKFEGVVSETSDWTRCPNCGGL